MTKLATFPIALPPDREIAEVLRRWDELDTNWEVDMADAGATQAALRQSILAVAFRGELIQ